MTEDLLISMPESASSQAHSLPWPFDLAAWLRRPSSILISLVQLRAMLASIPFATFLFLARSWIGASLEEMIDKRQPSLGSGSVGPQGAVPRCADCLFINVFSSFLEKHLSLPEITVMMQALTGTCHYRVLLLLLAQPTADTCLCRTGSTNSRSDG